MKPAQPPARGLVRGQVPGPGLAPVKHPDLPRRRTVSVIAALGALTVASAVGTTSLVLPQPAAAQLVDEFGSAGLRGAGSSFAQPLLANWSRDYREWRSGPMAIAAAGGGLDSAVPAPALDYEPVGSQAGIERLKAGSVDFAVSELPLSAEELASHRLVQVPIVTGAVAVTYHLPDDSGAPLRLDGATVVDIFLGRITRWSDPAIAARNPGQAFPDTPITVIHRADGSGTTYTFSNWLARASDDWAQKVGAGLTLAWPVGTGVRGSKAVVEGVINQPGSISYVNAVEARQRGASVALIAGRGRDSFVAPVPEAVRNAVTALAGVANPSALLLDAPGDKAYPIVATVYGLASEGRSRRSARAHQFLGWSLTHGLQRAEAMGYVALPPAVAEQARQTLAD